MPETGLTLADLEHRDFATVPEYAAVLRCDPRTVRSAIKAGEIPAVKVGTEYRIPVEWLRAATAPPLTAEQRAKLTRLLDSQPARSA